MFGKLKLAFAALLLIPTVSCAKPNYQDNHGSTPGAEKPFGEDCALNFASQKLSAKFEWQKFQTEEEPGSFLISFWSSEDTSTNPTLVDPTLKPAVVLWMPSMGHGSSPVKVSPTATPGIWEATSVWFSMPGRWEIRFQLKNGSTVIDEAVCGVRI